MKNKVSRDDFHPEIVMLNFIKRLDSILMVHGAYWLNSLWIGVTIGMAHSQFLPSESLQRQSLRGFQKAIDAEIEKLKRRGSMK